MKTELEKTLMTKYSSFFTLNGDETNKSITQPIAYSIECDDGWYDILDRLFIKLTNLQNEYNESHEEKIDAKVTQIKEKYGSLCFFVDVSTEEMFQAIQEAECESDITCQYCGTKENVGNTEGGVHTICEKCYKEYELECDWQKL